MEGNSKPVPTYPLRPRSGIKTPTELEWGIEKWLFSEFRLLATKEVRAVAFDLFCHARLSDPMGTLPKDQKVLAQLVGEPFDVWQRLMEFDPNPLHGWVVCECLGRGQRLYHPWSLQAAQKAQISHGGW